MMKKISKIIIIVLVLLSLNGSVVAENSKYQNLIDFLREQVNQIQEKILELQSSLSQIEKGVDRVEEILITNPLKMGDSGKEVENLQSFLSDYPDIYPEGVVSGYFGPLTKKAVKRFQEKYSEEVLNPWGLTAGTGYVGQTTLTKINKLSSYGLKPSFEEKQNENEENSSSSFELLDITKVIDGDTVVAEGGDHIRLLGIDSEESGSSCYAPAKERLEELVLGKEVKLEKEKTDKDKYNRYLRWIFSHGENINLKMVEEGLAICDFYNPDSEYKEECAELEREAKDKKNGCIWEEKLSCYCEEWQDTACGSGSCSSEQMRQVRECYPDKCQAEEKCVEKNSCFAFQCDWNKVTEENKLSEVVEAQNADKYIGDYKIVEGYVASVKRYSNPALFINLCDPYPNHCFLSIIWDSDWSAFPSNADQLYLGEKVRISGYIQKYQGKPEIILKSPSQIEVCKYEEEPVAPEEPIEEEPIEEEPTEPGEPVEEDPTEPEEPIEEEPTEPEEPIEEEPTEPEEEPDEPEIEPIGPIIQSPVNGHYYQVISEDSISWIEANKKASALQHDGMTGHLAVITSHEEWDWLWDNLENWSNKWLGGYQTGPGVWHWITREDWDYTYWYKKKKPETNGEENLLWWHQARWWAKKGERGGYIVEYEVEYKENIYFNSENGHYYEVVSSGPITWHEAKEKAENSAYKGMSGHLMTITSHAEVDWMFHRLAWMLKWLGGYQDTEDPNYNEPDGGWKWITGEEWDYTRWSTNSPTESKEGEDYLICGSTARWGDERSDSVKHGGREIRGYIVEYE